MKEIVIISGKGGTGKTSITASFAYLGGKDIVVINDTDHALLGLLSKNARLSLVELGQKLKMHPQVVRQHIKRLQKENVILGYTLKVNHNKLGFTHHKVFINLKKLTEENINALITHIKTLPQSIYITKALGQSDLEFEIMVKSETEFNEILRALRLKYTNIIKNLDSFVVFSQPYINYLPEMK